jgi:hypothetical protein
MGKPIEVRKARVAGKLPLLSRMGSNGNRIKQRYRIRLEKQRLAILEEGMWQNHIQANEHIVTPDGEEGEFPDGIIHHFA